MRTESEDEAFNDAQAGYPIERRLNRVERAVAAYHGQIELRFDDGMQVVFDSADGAVLCACEMQNRCAALPQVLSQKFALRIGIHRGFIRQRSNDVADNAPEITSQLAQADDAVLVSLDVVNALGKDLRQFIRPLEETVAGASVFLIGWREMPSGAHGGDLLRQTPPQSARPLLRLYFNLKTLEVSEYNPVVTIGRDPSSDVALADTHASRHHCRIERTAKGILLTDASVNGTLVVNEDKQELLIKNSSVALKSSGMIFLGRPFKGERRGGIRYEVL
ncbi:MAG: FHA domain-containing protein [Candidatus Accumulibacter sp.]|nr:FHA domain-containing protein [Accumulibacter sp.]